MSRRTLREPTNAAVVRHIPSFLSYGLGAGVAAFPALAGQLVLDSSDLGRLGLAVLTTQIAVGAGRVGAILARENSREKAYIRPSQVAAIASVACLPALAAAPQLDMVPLVLCALVGATIELRRMTMTSLRLQGVAGITWLALSSMAILISRWFSLPTPLSIEGLWAISGIACAILMMRPEPLPGGATQEARPLGWREFSASLGDFIAGSSMTIATTLIVGSTLGLDVLGRLRAAQNLAIPTNLAHSSTIYITSSPSMVADEQAAQRLGRWVPAAGAMGNAGLISMLSLVGFVDRAVAPLALALITTVWMSATAAPFTSKLRRSARPGPVLRARLVGLGLYLAGVATVYVMASGSVIRILAVQGASGIAATLMLWRLTARESAAALSDPTR